MSLQRVTLWWTCTECEGCGRVWEASKSTGYATTVPCALCWGFGRTSTHYYVTDKGPADGKLILYQSKDVAEKEVR